MRISPRLVASLLLCLTVAHVVVIHAHVADPFVDDSYITLRYARNLVEGRGLVFNPGERVEGYTHPLWVLLAAVSLALRLPPAFAMQVMGVVAWLGVLLSVIRAADDAGLRSPARWVGPMAIVLGASGGFWSLSGLETTCHAWAITEGVRLSLGDVRARRPLGLGSIAAFAAATLLRPEAVLWFGGALILVAWTARSGESQRPLVAGVMRAGAVFVLLLAPWLAFRRAYYGEWLPNTFYAKTGGDLRFVLGRGASYVGWSLLQGPYAGLAFATLVRPAQLRRPEVWLPISLTLAHLASVIALGGDYMWFGRFVLPVIGPLAMVTSVALDAWYREARRRVLPAFVAGIACLSGVLPWVWRDSLSSYRAATTDRFIPVGHWLRSHVQSDVLIATSAVGAIGWLSGKRMLDTQGLTDWHLARHIDSRLDPQLLKTTAGHGRGDAEYVLRRRPDLILLANVWLRQEPLTPQSLSKNLGATHITDRMLLLDPRFFEAYDVFNYPARNGRFLGMAVRKDCVVHPSHPEFAGPAPLVVAQ